LNRSLLHGVRVADFTWIGAGSFTTKLLADNGADVVKIESRGRMDSLRSSRPYKDGVPGINRSGYFADRNSSKRSIALNLKTDAGKELARRLIATSDVVANNFTPGTMEKFGLGYEAVREIRKDIIYIAMSMQGAAGPEHKYLGYGLTMGALTGLQFLSGLPDREPAGTGTNFSDHIPNPCHAAFAILAALRHRRRTGEGQYIDVAQTEPTIALLGPTMIDSSANDRILDRSGNERCPRAPHAVFRCLGEDRWIAISAWQDASWAALCRVLGDPPFAHAPELASADGRWARRHEIEAGIAAITCYWDAEDLMSALQRAGVPAGVVRTAADIVDEDPQLRHREHWVTLLHPEMGESIYNAPPFRISGAPVPPFAPAPLLGQHTDEVLTGILGLSLSEVEALRREDVLT
jgi:benzylsuccinate CoA-transferase BbsF subunit